MDLELQSEHRALRETVRAFADQVIRPLAAGIDREHRFPAQVIAAAAELDLLGTLVPEDYGGAGMDHLAFTLCIEEIARACASCAVIIDVHSSVGSEPIVLFGTEEQKRTWLPALAAGRVLGAFCLSEPGSGSDAASLQASAHHDGAGWVLTGTKTFITNIGEAGLYTVFARSAEGISAFLVPGDAPGLRVGQVFRKMGLNGSPTGELVLDEVRVGAGALLHAPGQGFQVAMRALDSGRIGISGQALGIAGAALEEGAAFLRERRQFDRPLASFQGLQFMVADMGTRLEAARRLAYHAAWLCDQGRPFTKEASMAKLFCTDTAMAVATDAVQLGGGYGFTQELALERHFRDAKALQIYEGSNQVQRIVIARDVLR
ncbi:MAG: acyl-CoA dehydrogenase family protein [Candidatus Dormibacteraeota bacterium]|nr:acyl-CoA dehydrogenase family protein [Candidatus Dormibacteraeota bacterium]MBO0744221.1 acyl-CoA dehydrogenase family protein [Candidatus Dormibacteraeota bacterium]